MGNVITISIRDMALIAVGKKGVTVLFPSVGHSTRVTFGPAWDDYAVDVTGRFSFSIHKDGKPLKAAATTPPAGHYGVDLAWASGKRGTIAKSNLAGSVPPKLNGRLTLAGGQLREYPAQVRGGVFAERLWDFGGGRQHRLSDRVDFEFEAERRARYELVGGNIAIPLSPEAPICLWNGDHSRKFRLMMADAPSLGFLGGPTPPPRAKPGPGKLEAQRRAPLRDLPEFAELTKLAGVGAIVPRLIDGTTNETYDDRPCPFAFMKM